MDFLSSISTNTVVIVLSLAATLLIMALVGGIYYGLFHKRRTGDFTKQLDEVVRDANGEEVADPDPNLIEKWNIYWGRVLGESNIGRYSTEGVHAGRDAAILLAVSALLTLAITKSFVFFLLIPSGILYGLVMVARASGNKRNRMLNDQLPGMLFALKSNLQAGNTNERALVEIVDSMPEPLYSDIVVARNVLSTNGTFQEALEEMSENTSSQDMKFLCSCMVQASMSGTNMTNQLDNIQKVLEARREVENKIDIAVKAVSPALWLSALIIPVMFVISYFMDSAAADFWFKNIVSWIGFLSVLALYLLGLMLTKRQVDKVRNI